MYKKENHKKKPAIILTTGFECTRQLHHLISTIFRVYKERSVRRTTWQRPDGRRFEEKFIQK